MLSGDQSSIESTFVCRAELYHDEKRECQHSVFSLNEDAYLTGRMPQGFVTMCTAFNVSNPFFNGRRAKVYRNVGLAKFEESHLGSHCRHSVPSFDGSTIPCFRPYASGV